MLSKGTVSVGTPGRVSTVVADAVRGSITGGQLGAGEFVPSVRKLARMYSVDLKTALRAMKVLEAEGLVRAVRGRGFRVLSQAGPVEAPLAYIGAWSPEESSGAGSTVYLAHAVQDIAARHGRCVISVPANASPSQLSATLKRHGVLGAVVVSYDRSQVKAVLAEGLPVVMIDSDVDLPEVDTVNQDGQSGGYQAARYALARGRKRVAWLGNARGDNHLTDRLSGAMAGMRVAGQPIADDLIGIVDVSEAEQKVREFLSRRDPPDAVIAPWVNFMLAAGRACQAMRLKVGRDIDVIGWSCREVLDRDLSGHVSRGNISALVTWSALEMARTAVARLIQRSEFPELPSVRIKVPTRLILTRNDSGRRP